MTPTRPLRRFALLLVLSAVLAAARPALAQSDSDDSREAARLAEALNIRGGSTVGEIGAGDGALTLAMSRIVGESGRVFATELGDDRLATLRRAVERAGAANVQVLAADPVKTNLEAGCCDAVFMRNVYHHFDDPDAMNRSLFEALRPGGMLAVIDFAPPPGRAAVPPRERDEDGSHGVSADSLAEELKRSGFEIASTERGGNGRGERRVMVVARKPRT